MASGYTNTNEYKESIEREHGNYALSNAKKLEAKRIKNGWRYIEINSRLQVFVPCDKNGNPTKQGQLMINKIINR